MILWTKASLHLLPALPLCPATTSYSYVGSGTIASSVSMLIQVRSFFGDTHTHTHTYTFSNHLHPQICTNRLFFLQCCWYNFTIIFLSQTTGTSSQSVFGHREIVTCIAFSEERGVWSIPGSGLLATGSRDATVLVWRWCGRQRRVVGSFSGLQNS